MWVTCLVYKRTVRVNWFSLILEMFAKRFLIVYSSPDTLKGLEGGIGDAQHLSVSWLQINLMDPGPILT